MNIRLLISGLYEWYGKCCSNGNLHPRYLSLGKLMQKKLFCFHPDDFPPDPYRHHFIPAPVYNNQSHVLLHIKQLILRLNGMLSSYNIEGRMKDPLPVLISHTRDCSLPLEKRAIPFYYDTLNGALPLYRSWSFSCGVKARFSFTRGVIVGTPGVLHQPSSWQIRSFYAS